MGYLDFLGPAKVLVYVGLSIIVFFNIVITILVPFAFIFTIPVFIITAVIWLLAIVGVKKKALDDGCRLEGGNQICD